MDLVDYSTADVLTILSKVKTKPSANVESETVEFKEFGSVDSLFNNKNLAEELCALANYRGGVLIVGVKDSSNLNDDNWGMQLCGFLVVDVLDCENRIKGKLQNINSLRVENINFESKNYVAIYVIKNIEALVTTSSGKACIRDGRSSRPMSSSEMEKAVKSLQNYDWSDDYIQNVDISHLEAKDLDAAFVEYSKQFVENDKPTQNKFLEAIGITKNGLLTKGGLLFLGSQKAIKKYLGDYEFRFSWKEGTDLIVNEVWSSNIWSSINKAKKLFQKCVKEGEVDFKGNKYRVPNLDPVAFHEAFINAVVHRDYTNDGMISVDFSGSDLSITSPGSFYGGITSDNIAYHQPRHRNKSLARILMAYRLVDRAGMGILRMGIKSLVYGRSYPKIEEQNNSIVVSMQTEYIRPTIFILTHGKQQLFVADLVILNKLYESSYISLKETSDLIKRVVPDTWIATNDFTSRWNTYVELCGSNEDLFIKVKDEALDFFDLHKKFKLPQNSERLVKLFKMLKKHQWATSEDVSKLLGYKQSQSASRLLNSVSWIERTGKGMSTRYKLSSEYI